MFHKIAKILSFAILKSKAGERAEVLSELCLKRSIGALPKRFGGENNMSTRRRTTAPRSAGLHRELASAYADGLEYQKNHEAEIIAKEFLSDSFTTFKKLEEKTGITSSSEKLRAYATGSPSNTAILVLKKYVDLYGDRAHADIRARWERTKTHPNTIKVLEAHEMEVKRTSVIKLLRETSKGDVTQHQKAVLNLAARVLEGESIRSILSKRKNMGLDKALYGLIEEVPAIAPDARPFINKQLGILERK